MTNTQLRRGYEELSATYGNMLAREIALEERMVSLGRDQIRKQIDRARMSGNESGTGYGKNLIARSVDRLGAAISEFITKAETGGAGRRHIAVKHLKQLDPEVAGFIAMRCVVDGLTGKKQGLTRTAIIIGSRIEDEVRFSSWKGAAKDMEDAEERKKAKRIYDRAAEKAKKGTMYHRKKATLAGYERRFAEEEWTPWPEQDKLHVGMKLVDMIVATGYVEVGDEVKSRTKTTKVIVPSARLVEHIEREVSRSELLSPATLPMIVKPLDWTTPFDGGYLTAEAQGRNSMVKTGNRNYLMEMADHAEEMPMVYDGLNALQATRWRINRGVHAALSQLWEAVSLRPSYRSRTSRLTRKPCPLLSVVQPTSPSHAGSTRLSWNTMSCPTRKRPTPQMSPSTSRHTFPTVRLSWLPHRPRTSFWLWSAANRTTCMSTSSTGGTPRRFSPAGASGRSLRGARS